MATNMNQDLGKLLECPVCLEDMQTPKVLPCAHTVCAKCLENIVRYGTLACPECRTKVTLGPKGVNGLPNNPTIMNMIDMLRPKKTPKKDDCNMKAVIAGKVGEYSSAVAELWNLDAMIRNNLDNVSAQIDQKVSDLVSEARQYGHKLKKRASDISEAELYKVSNCIKKMQTLLDVLSTCNVDSSKYTSAVTEMEQSIPQSFESNIMTLEEEGKLKLKSISADLFTKSKKFPQVPTKLIKEFTVEAVTATGFTFLPNGDFIIEQNKKMKRFDKSGTVVTVSKESIDNVTEIIYHEGLHKVLVANLTDTIFIFDTSSLDLESFCQIEFENIKCWDMCISGHNIATRELDRNIIAVFKMDGSFLYSVTPSDKLRDWRLNRHGQVFATSNRGIICFDIQENQPHSKLVMKLSHYQSGFALEIDPHGNIWVSLADEGRVSVLQPSEQFPMILDVTDNPDMIHPSDLHCSKDGRIAIKDRATMSVTIFTVK